MAQECLDFETEHPTWLFCDDFEDGTPLVREGRYFEVPDDGGEFVPMAETGLGGSTAMRALWQVGEVDAGNLKLGFGRNPSGYMNRGIHEDQDFREIYYRMYLRLEEGWQGNPAKLSRATVFVASDWSQGMIAHVWNGPDVRLGLDPVRCVGDDDQPACVGYNDFDNMDWLGFQPGATPIFEPAQADRWFCIETHVRLNDPDASNGLQEIWIDGELDARAENLNFVRGYTDYALNGIFFENYWNGGSPREQERYFDNIVVSTQRIGCLTEAVFADGFESGDVNAWTASVP